MAASHQRELAKAEPRSREQRPCVSVGGFRKRGRSLHRPGIGSELGCYLCPFSLMRVMRRSVTGSRLAAASSGFRLGVASSVSSATPALPQWPFVSAFPSNGCSRKDEDRSNDLVRLACCFRNTLKTRILSPSPTKSMSPFSLSLSLRASLTEFLALWASVPRTESLVDFSKYSSQPFRV